MRKIVAIVLALALAFGIMPSSLPKAQAQGETVTITFEAPEAEEGVPEPITIEAGTAPCDADEWYDLEDPYREDYIFEGWSKQSESSEADFDEEEVLNEDITLYAVWYEDTGEYLEEDPEEDLEEDPEEDFEEDLEEYPDSYTITLDAKGGTGVPESIEGESYDYLFDILYPYTPNREGYYFKGWSLIDNNEDAIIEDYGEWLDDDITVYAIWKEGIKVKFDPNGGQGEIQTTIWPKGESNEKFMINLEDPTRDGYEFVGWARSKTADEADFESDEALSEPTTLYAVWRGIATVQFVANNGTSKTVTEEIYKDWPMSQQIYFNEFGFKKDGFEFYGWSTDASATVPNIDDEYKVTGPITLYAVWGLPAVEVTVFADVPGWQPKRVKVPKGKSLDEIQKLEPEREGYALAGWVLTDEDYEDYYYYDEDEEYYYDEEEGYQEGDIDFFDLKWPLFRPISIRAIWQKKSR